MRVYLRESTKDDGQIIVKWRNDPAILKHCFSKGKITAESHQRFFENFVLTGKYKQFIVERVDEDFGVSSYPIATISLKDFDTENKRCELCLFTSPDEEWNSVSQSTAINLILEKAFNEFDMHKVYSYVFREFSDEVHLLIRAGFCVEALFKNEAIKENGSYADVYRMSITKDEWENQK